jgi:hypothetical protein
MRQTLSLLFHPAPPSGAALFLAIWLFVIDGLLAAVYFSGWPV